MVKYTKGEAPAQRGAQLSSKHDRGEVRGNNIRLTEKVHSTPDWPQAPCTGLEVSAIPGLQGCPMAVSEVLSCGVGALR